MDCPGLFLSGLRHTAIFSKIFLQKPLGHLILKGTTAAAARTGSAPAEVLYDEQEEQICQENGCTD